MFTFLRTDIQFDISVREDTNHGDGKPVTAGFVNEPWHWKYSSAVDYMTNDKGLLDLVFLE